MKLFTTEQEKLSWSQRTDWNERLWRHLLLEKLNTNWGYALGLMLALLVAWVAGTQSPAFAWMLLAATVLLPALIASFLFPTKGTLVLLVLGFLVSWAKRMDESIPVGTLIDLWLVVVSAGIFYRQIGLRSWRFLAHPIVLLAGIWAVYCGLELLNPWSRAQLGWLYACRPLVGWMLLIPIGLFAFRRVRHIMALHRLWIGLVVLASVYGLWQWWAGPSDREFAWMMDSPERFSLLFNGKRYRVFSIFTDPTAFGILTAITATIAGILGWRPGASLHRKLLTLGIVVLLLLATVATGSRMALVLPAVGLVFYALLSLRREALVLSGVLMVLWVSLLTIQIDHPLWEKASRMADPWSSFAAELREQNQSWVQPFLHDHPIGAGLGKTGHLGQRFAPDVWLSQFPPDSAYMRIALETGYIGLFLYLSLMAAILIAGVRGMFRVSSPRLRVTYQAYLTFTFLVIMASYTQQVTTQLPMGLMFFLASAILVNLGRTGEEEKSF